MKLIPPPERRQRAALDDGALHGIDVALTVAAFLGIGYLLDRWLGTSPWLMIGFTVLAAIGFFARYKYRYELEMDRLGAERRERANASSSASANEDANP